MLTIHNFFSPFTHLTLTPASLTFRMFCKLYHLFNNSKNWISRHWTQTTTG